MGVAPELHDKIFLPFFTSKTNATGTGLGLSISHDIVARGHRGSIVLESEPGSFAAFTVKLPRSRGPH